MILDVKEKKTVDKCKITVNAFRDISGCEQMSRY